MADVVFALLCKRCDKEWVPRVAYRPVQCPRCKSPYWDKERVNVAIESGTEQSWVEDRVKEINEDTLAATNEMIREVVGRSPLPADLRKQPAPKKHNPKTCKIYKCGMCAVQGGQK